MKVIHLINNKHFIRQKLSDYFRYNQTDVQIVLHICLLPFCFSFYAF